MKLSDQVRELEAELARLRVRWEVIADRASERERQRAEQAERERDEARALIAEYEREPSDDEREVLWVANYATWPPREAARAVLAKWREIARGRVKP